MADLNALIAQGVQFKEPPNPFAQYAQMQQLQQGAQQNQLNQMKMQEYQRGVQEQEGVRNYLKSTPNFDPTNPTHQTGLMQVAPTTAPKLIESFLTTRKTVGDIAKTTADTAGKTFETQVAKANKAITDIAGLGSAEEAIASIDQHLAKGDIDQAKADTLKSQLSQAPNFQSWRTNMVMGVLGAKDKLEATKPTPMEVTRADGSKIFLDKNPNSPTFNTEIMTGQVAGMTPFQTGTLAATGRTQDITMRGQNLLDTREKENIAIRQETQRREGDPAFKQQMAQAAATGQAIAKDQALAQQVLPKVLDTAEQTISQIDNMIGKRDTEGKLLKGQAPHPGFANAVGAGFPGARFIPGTPAADFQSRFDQVKGGAFLQAFETLKGGGSISNVEGEKGTSALNRMNLAQSEKEFVNAAREFQGIVRRGVERAKIRVGGNAPTPVAAGQNSLSPAEQTELDQLRKRFGGK